ncbi:MAG: hypothetical protein IKR59_00195 [Lachnospiraceae bacterium]|nr:hypothetical protein [Lachnospiraceae bacterium]
MDNEIMTEDAAFEREEEIAQESADVYKHEFKKPFEYDGNKYSVLVFDWGSLTGKDGLDIETELTAIGKAAFVPAFNGEYLIRMASKACTDPIGSDAFENMSLSDFTKITREARNFILRSER